MPSSAVLISHGGRLTHLSDGILESLLPYGNHYEIGSPLRRTRMVGKRCEPGPDSQVPLTTRISVSPVWVIRSTLRAAPRPINSMTNWSCGRTSNSRPHGSICNKNGRQPS